MLRREREKQIELIKEGERDRGQKQTLKSHTRKRERERERTGGTESTEKENEIIKDRNIGREKEINNHCCFTPPQRNNPPLPQLALVPGHLGP